jgi:hypothetical protein
MATASGKTATTEQPQPEGGGYSKPDAPAALGAATSAAAEFQRPTKEVLLRFLTNAKAKMESDETRQLLKDPAIEKPGLKLIELQVAEWDPLGINRDFGCNVLSSIEKEYPGDQELFEARRDFMRTCERTFVRSLVDRAPDHELLERKKPMPRDTFLQFFDGCNAQMNLPEFHERLARYIEEHKSPPNKIIIEMQRDMLETFGFEREHGCNQLSGIGRNFPNDAELHGAFRQWQHTAESTCMQIVRSVMGHPAPQPPVELKLFDSDEERDKFHAEAKDSIDKMAPEERTQLIHKMSQKMAVVARLPADARVKHFKGLSKEDQLEFTKAQILAMEFMKKMQESHGHAHQGCPAQQAHEPDEQQAAAQSMGGSAPPSQQQMM